MNELLWSPKERLCIRLLQKTSNTRFSLLQIYAFILRHAFFSNLSLLTKLISAFSDPSLPGISHPLAGIWHARRIFYHHRNVAHDSFLCNSMIRAHVQHSQFDESFALYRTLLKENTFVPDNYTFPFLLKACAINPNLRVGEQIHNHVMKMGFCSDLYVSTGLVDLYSKVGEIQLARLLFDEMSVRSPAAWTAVIVGHARIGDLSTAIELFERMPDKDIPSFNAMIDIFTRMGRMEIARKVFEEMPTKNVVSWTSLISGYSKNGELEAARLFFDAMPEKNLFSWNAMIGGYCHNKQPNKALELFREMQTSSSFRPDRVTVVSIIPAIADLGALDLGCWIHSYVRRNRLDKESNVCTALIDMYAKCGEVTKARHLFDGMVEREVASWNAMINGLAVNGRAINALEVFFEMRREGVIPNDVTMIGVLSACSHGGLVEQGKMWFREMESFGIKPRIEHYGCMVDLFGRAGLLKDAEELIESMSCEVNGIVLSSLLFACGTHGDAPRGERVMKRVIEMEPWNVGNYVMARNMYAGQRRWADAEKVKTMMRKNGTKKEAGCSVIEVNCRVSEFVAGDRVHPEWEAICVILENLWVHMKGRRGNNFHLDILYC